MKTRAHERAFSRSDLVASLAMVGLLGVLAGPAWGTGQRQGNTAECFSNLKRLGMGILQYAAENQDLVPPNPDDGNTIAGHNWCPGQAGRGASAEFNPDILQDPTRSLLFPYLDGDVQVFKCPADQRRGVYQGSDPAKQGMEVSAARTVSVNHAVGTVCALFPGGHTGMPYLRTHAPWLDNNHAHTRYGPYRTFGKLSDLVEPGPAMTWTIIEEDPDSLNDGGFGLGMVNAEWIDWPGTLHDFGASLSFADGHVETHRWVDSRTVVVNGGVARTSVPGSEDYVWLRDRTSALK